MMKQPSDNVRARLLLLVGLALLCLSAFPIGSQEPQEQGGETAEAAEPAEEEVSGEIRSDLEIPLQEKVKALGEQKNADGVKNVRGSYMQRFIKMEENTYQVAFHKRTAEKEELKTERYLLTLKMDPGTKKWSIAKEDLQHTVTGLLYRSVLGDETFREFDSFTFEREGIKLSGGKGSMYVDYWRGKPARLVLTAENLKYDYAPPHELNYYELIHVVKNQYPSEIVFEPEGLGFACLAEDCEEILSSSFSGLRESSIERLDPKVKKNYDEFKDIVEKARRENPMGGFNLIPRPEQRFWGVTVKKKGSDHFAGLTYDNTEPEEMTFRVTRKGPLYTYYSEATRKSGVLDYDLEERPDADALDYDLVSLKGSVRMAVETSDKMESDLTYKLKIKRPLDTLDFDIVQVRAFKAEEKETKNPNLRLHFIEDGNGEELTYIGRGGTRGLIVLPNPLKAGDELVLHVKYSMGNIIYQLNPSYFYVPRSGWLPMVRYTDMIDEFELAVTTPEKYEILGIGQNVGESVKDGLRTANFTSTFPVNFPTVIFGVYIQDKPRFDAVRMDGTKIPVNIYVDKTSTMQFSQWKSREEAMGEAGSGIAQVRANSLRSLAEQAANSLNVYREIYGTDYPFGKLDLVNVPFQGGGQSPVSIVYLGSDFFRAVGTLAAEGGAYISKFMETLVAHEVGHQWWGSLVNNGNFRNYWFVESLAEYSSALFVESLHGAQDPEKGRKAYLEKVEDWRRTVLVANIMASVQDADTMWSGEFPGMARQAAIYNQGPYAFHILRMTFGDEKFFAFLKNLASELKGKEIITRDIQNVAEKSFGGTMEWFFDQWIRGVGLPEYSFNYRTRQAEDRNYVVEGTIKQHIVVGNKKDTLPGKTYRGILTVTVIGKDKKEYPVRVLVEKEQTPFAFKVPVQPLDVVLNKYGEVLAHDVLVNRDF